MKLDATGLTLQQIGAAAGLLLALPALEINGLPPVAAEVFPPMRKGFYGLRAALLMGVFLALLR